MERNYEKLVNAIILQAVKDYRRALKGLKRNAENSDAKSDAETIERFFWPQWYSALTSVDGEFLIRRLREEVEA